LSSPPPNPSFCFCGPGAWLSCSLNHFFINPLGHATLSPLPRLYLYPDAGFVGEESVRVFCVFVVFLFLFGVCVPLFLRFCGGFFFVVLGCFFFGLPDWFDSHRGPPADGHVFLLLFALQHSPFLFHHPRQPSYTSESSFVTNDILRSWLLVPPVPFYPACHGVLLRSVIGRMREFLESPSSNSVLNRVHIRFGVSLTRTINSSSHSFPPPPPGVRSILLSFFSLLSGPFFYELRCTYREIPAFQCFP